MQVSDGRALSRAFVIAPALLLAVAGYRIWSRTATPAETTVAAAPAEIRPTAWAATAGAEDMDEADIPDGLRAYGDGHLVKARAVRDVFDHFLLGIGASSMSHIDKRVRRHIIATLSAPARGEALDLWQRYRAYLDTENKLLESSRGDTSSLDLVRIGQFLQSRRALRWKMLPDVAQTWFGEEEAAEIRQLDRLTISQNGSLGSEEKARRLAALDARDPVFRAAADKGAPIAKLARLVADMEASKQSPDAIAAAVASTGNAAAAGRIRQWARAEADWETRYKDYLDERTRIEAGRLGTDATEEMLAAARARHFPVPAEAMRARALDAR